MIDVIDPVLLLLVAAFVPAVATTAAGAWRTAWTVPAAVVTTAIAFAAALNGWAAGGGRVDVAWSPTWRMRLTFELDGLAVLYSLLATGIGLAVVVYSAGYVPAHLRHEERPPAQIVPFYAFVLLFMGAMVGLVLAQDLMLIFVFWDLTAIASYFLIGYDRHTAVSRRAALMALLVTGVSAVFFLIGALVLWEAYRTFDLAELVAGIQPGSRLTVAGLLMALAGLAKSAQVPFHFWLPRAMAAPTPVSAYLHSAAMVAAGVFLLSRLYPLLGLSDSLRDGLVVVGFTSMAIGGALALSRNELKPLLAYSTISQYGYVVVMLGIGGEYGAAGASFYVLAHAVAKSALFMTAGAVTEATGEKRISHLGGLWRSQPVLAAGSAAAAATLAALPLTIGFFKDELFFHAAVEHSRLVAALAMAGAGLTVAYIGRFWIGVFLGDRQTPATPLPAALVWPVAVLGAIGVLGGIVVGPADHLAESAGEATLNAFAHVSPAYRLEATAENLLALGAYALGALLLATRGWWRPAAIAAARLGERVGPEHGYHRVLAGLNAVSDRIHTIEVRDLRSRVATILAPAGVLVFAGFLATPTRREAFAVGAVTADDAPLLLALGLAVFAAFATTVPRDHLALALVVSGVGYGLAIVYAFRAAPNVALVAVLIETLLALLFIGILLALPRDLLRGATERRSARAVRWRDYLLAGTSAIVMFLIVWGVLSEPAPQESVSTALLQATPTAHAKNAVTAILADFRGLDTMGEITVVGMVLLGIATLLRRRSEL